MAVAQAESFSEDGVTPPRVPGYVELSRPQLSLSQVRPYLPGRVLDVRISGLAVAVHRRGHAMNQRVTPSRPWRKSRWRLNGVFLPLRRPGLFGRSQLLLECICGPARSRAIFRRSMVETDDRESLLARRS